MSIHNLSVSVRRSDIATIKCSECDHSRMSDQVELSPEITSHKAIETMMRLPGLTRVRLSDKLVKQATELAADLGLRGGDTLYVAAAAQFNLPLATYD